MKNLIGTNVRLFLISGMATTLKIDMKVTNFREDKNVIFGREILPTGRTGRKEYAFKIEKDSLIFPLDDKKQFPVYPEDEKFNGFTGNARLNLWAESKEALAEAVKTKNLNPGFTAYDKVNYTTAMHTYEPVFVAEEKEQL